MPFNQVSFQLPLPPKGSTRTSKDEEEGDDEEEVEEVSDDVQEVID